MGKECKQHAAPLRTARNLLIFLEKKKQKNKKTKKQQQQQNTRIQGIEYKVALKQFQCFRLQYLSFFYFCFNLLHA